MDEVWIFADWNKLSADEKSALLEMNVTDVVLGIAMEPKLWKRSMSNEQIVNDVQWLTSNGMRAHLMCWFTRQRKFIKAAAKSMKEAVTIVRNADLSVDSILFDCEHHWNQSNTLKLDAAIDLVVEEFKWAFNDDNLLVGITGLANLTKSCKAMLKICDYGIGQGYAVWFPDSVGGPDHFTHSLDYEPGKPEGLVRETWTPHAEDEVLGLACYYEKRPTRFGLPAMTAETARTLSLQAARDLGYTKVAYWSLNHCPGDKPWRQERRDFIRRILAGADPITEPEPAPLPVEKTAPTKASAQWLLVKLGYDLGNYGPDKDGVDGEWGMKSQAALEDFRDKINLHPRPPRTHPLVLADMLALTEAYRQGRTAV